MQVSKGAIEDQCYVTVPRPFATSELVHRVTGEFHDLPGLRLTLEQAMRLFDKDRQSIGFVLDRLIDQHVLARDRFGRYKLAGK
jgi:hypothetical protein